MICLNSAGSPARSQVDSVRREGPPRGTAASFWLVRRPSRRPGPSGRAAITGLMEGALSSPPLDGASTGTSAAVLERATGGPTARGRLPSSRRPLGCGRTSGSRDAASKGDTPSAGSVLRATEPSPATRPTARPRATAIARHPTLRRTWPGEDPRPQCAFEVSMICVFCNSHQLTQLAALFIDARAE